MIPYNVLTPTRHGLMLANRNDVYVGGSLLGYGEFSELEVAFLGRYVSPGDIVLDIGANVGALTVPLAQQVGPRGCVLAFEPQRLLYQTLCANVALNSLTNVVAFQYAVGAAAGSSRVPLTDPTKVNNFGGIALAPDANGEVVAMVTLDEMRLPPAGLIKADVEGMEADVLRGGRGYLADYRPVLYLEADRGDRRAALLALLDELDYDAWSHDPPLYNPDNFRREPKNAWPNVVSINLLCLPRGGGHPVPDLERAA